MDRYSTPGFRKPDEQVESHDLNGTNVDSYYTYQNASQFDMMPSFFGTSLVGGATHAMYPPSPLNPISAYNLNINPFNKLDAFPPPFAATQSCWNPNTNDTTQVEPSASSCDKHGISFGYSQKAQKQSTESEFRCRWQGCVYNGTFAKEATLMRHIKSTHVSPELYKCPNKGCNKSFGRKDKFKTHVRLVHPENPNQCSHCYE